MKFEHQLKSLDRADDSSSAQILSQAIDFKDFAQNGKNHGPSDTAHLPGLQLVDSRIDRCLSGTSVGPCIKSVLRNGRNV